MPGSSHRQAGPPARGTYPRRQRVDARDNRQRILEAAYGVFEAQGVKVSVLEIIHHAGVGRSTFFRHFPDRETLLLALHESFLRTLEGRVRELGEQDDALFAWLDFYVEQSAQRAVLVNYWLAHLDTAAIGNATNRLLTLLTPLLERAIEAGLCRRDIDPSDLGVVLHALTLRDPFTSREQRHAVGRRALFLIRSGIQPMAPLPG